MTHSVDPLPSKAPAGGHPRRTFFRLLTGAVGLAAGVLAGVPLVSYFFGVRRREAPWVMLGAADSFAMDQTRLVTFDNPLRTPWDGVTALTGVYVRNQGPDANGQARFLVLAVNCAHLGCPVSWFPQSGLFLCPCHGGVYYADGRRASGPPPRGMFHCRWRVSKGNLEVQAPHYPTLQDTLTDDEPGANEA